MKYAVLGVPFNERPPEQANRNVDRMGNDAKKAGNAVTKFFNDLF